MSGSKLDSFLHHDKQMQGTGNTSLAFKSVSRKELKKKQQQAQEATTTTTTPQTTQPGQTGSSGSAGGVKFATPVNAVKYDKNSVPESLGFLGLALIQNQQKLTSLMCYDPATQQQHILIPITDTFPYVVQENNYFTFWDLQGQQYACQTQNEESLQALILHIELNKYSFHLFKVSSASVEKNENSTDPEKFFTADLLPVDQLSQRIIKTNDMVRVKYTVHLLSQTQQCQSTDTSLTSILGPSVLDSSSSSSKDGGIIDTGKSLIIGNIGKDLEALHLGLEGSIKNVPRVIIASSVYCYGSKETTKIPPNSDLVFLCTIDKVKQGPTTAATTTAVTETTRPISTHNQTQDKTHHHHQTQPQQQPTPVITPSLTSNGEDRPQSSSIISVGGSIGGQDDEETAKKARLKQRMARVAAGATGQTIPGLNPDTIIPANDGQNDLKYAAGQPNHETSTPETPQVSYSHHQQPHHQQPHQQQQQQPVQVMPQEMMQHQQQYNSGNFDSQQNGQNMGQNGQNIGQNGQTTLQYAPSHMNLPPSQQQQQQQFYNQNNQSPHQQGHQHQFSPTQSQFPPQTPSYQPMNSPNNGFYQGGSQYQQQQQPQLQQSLTQHHQQQHLLSPTSPNQLYNHQNYLQNGQNNSQNHLLLQNGQNVQNLNQNPLPPVLTSGNVQSLLEHTSNRVEHLYVMLSNPISTPHASGVSPSSSSSSSSSKSSETDIKPENLAPISATHIIATFQHLINQVNLQNDFITDLKLKLAQARANNTSNATAQALGLSNNGQSSSSSSSHEDQEQIEALQKQIIQFQQLQRAKNKEYNALLIKYNDLEIKFDSLSSSSTVTSPMAQQSPMGTAQQQLNIKDSIEYQTIIEKMNEFKNLIDEKDEKILFLQQKNDENNDKNDDISSKDNDNHISTQLRQRIEEMLSKEADLDDKLAEKNLENENLFAKISALQAQIVENRKNVPNSDETPVQIADLTESGQYIELQSKFDQLQVELTQKDGKINEFEEKLKEKINENNKKDEKISQLEAQLMESNDSIKNASTSSNEEVTLLTNRIVEMTTKIEENKVTNDKKDEKILKLEEKLEIFNKKISEIEEKDERSSQFATILAEFTAYKDIYTISNDDIESIKLQVQEDTANQAKIRQEKIINQAKSRMDALNANIEELTIEKVNLEEKLDNVVIQAKERMEKLKTLCTDLKTQNGLLNDQLLQRDEESGQGNEAIIIIRTQLIDTQKELDEIKEKNNEKDKENLLLKYEIEEKNIKIENFIEKINKIEKNNEELLTQIDTITTQNNNKNNNEFEEKNQKILQQEDKIEKLVLEIDEIKNALIEKKNEIDEMKNCIIDKNDEITSLTEETQALQATVDMKNNHIDGLQLNIDKLTQESIEMNEKINNKNKIENEKKNNDNEKITEDKNNDIQNETEILTSSVSEDTIEVPQVKVQDVTESIDTDIIIEKPVEPVAAAAAVVAQTKSTKKSEKNSKNNKNNNKKNQNQQKENDEKAAEAIRIQAEQKAIEEEEAAKKAQLEIERLALEKIEQEAQEKKAQEEADAKAAEEKKAQQEADAKAAQEEADAKAAEEKQAQEEAAKQARLQAEEAEAEHLRVEAEAAEQARIQAEEAEAERFRVETEAAERLRLEAAEEAEKAEQARNIAEQSFTESDDRDNLIQEEIESKPIKQENFIQKSSPFDLFGNDDDDADDNLLGGGSNIVPPITSPPKMAAPPSSQPQTPVSPKTTGVPKTIVPSFMGSSSLFGDDDDDDDLFSGKSPTIKVTSGTGGSLFDDDLF